MRRTLEESKERATEGRLLTPAEVATWLQVTPKQVLRMPVPRRKLGRRTVRYAREDVQEWLDNQRTNR